MDRVDLIVHVEHFALVEREGLDDVQEGVGMDRLFKRLAEQVLTHFWVGDVFENGEDDVVADKALSCAEEAEVAHDDASLICTERV